TAPTVCSTPPSHSASAPSRSPTCSPPSSGLWPPCGSTGSSPAARTAKPVRKVRVIVVRILGSPNQSARLVFLAGDRLELHLYKIVFDAVRVAKHLCATQRRSDSGDQRLGKPAP